MEINSIIKNITSKLYIQAKNLKLNLSEYFINHIIYTVRTKLEKSLASFAFDALETIKLLFIKNSLNKFLSFLSSSTIKMCELIIHLLSHILF